MTGGMNKMSLSRCNAAGFPEKQGLYDPAFNHENCGIGFVVRSDGIPNHAIVQNGIQILMNLEHRGAVGGDKSTGDGAGILLQIPDRFFRKTYPEIHLPDPGHYAVGMVFLPSDSKLAKDCITISNNTIEEERCEVLGWREVPVENCHLGRLARSTEPCIQQVFIHHKGIEKVHFERKLYIIRRQIEKRVAGLQDQDFSQFYIVSFSSRTVIYKGLLTGTQLAHFYPDLRDEQCISVFSLVHQRYSTNTLPTWNLAQPFRFLAHNGEINTLRGNINRMKAREPHMKSKLFGDDIEKIKPVIIEGGSDSAIFDNVLELMVMAGRSLPHAMMMMIPEAFAPAIQMSEDKRSFY
jgi:glutamate synthase domain-containing protein 1